MNSHGKYIDGYEKDNLVIRNRVKNKEPAQPFIPTIKTDSS